VDAYVEAHEEP
jgi:hypothetical protein